MRVPRRVAHLLGRVDELLEDAKRGRAETPMRSGACSSRRLPPATPATPVS